MITTLRQLFHFLFPVPDVVEVANSLTKADIAKLYSPALHAGATYLLPYQDPSVRALIQACKFHHSPQAAALLSFVLSQWLMEKSTPLTILPIPLSKQRERVRDHNQVATIVSGATPNTPHTVASDILYRCRDTAPQTSLSRNERLANMEGAFATTKHGNLENQHILLLDDVVTTGATLSAAKTALLPLSPASITTLAMAH